MLKPKHIVAIRHSIELAALSAILGCAAAYADSSDGGVIIGIDAGRADAHKYCDGIADCDHADTSVRGDIGYQFNKNWSLEFGYTSFGTLFKAHDNRFDARQKANAWTVSGIGTLPLSERFGLFGRVGAARYDTDNKGTVQGVRVRDENEVKPYFGAGVKYDLTANFSLRAEYQYYADISGVDGSSDDVQGLYAGGILRF